MLFVKVKPVEIDIPIQKAQTRAYNNLVVAWGGTIKYNAHGRCYRNKTESGYIAEVFTGGEEYKEVYMDDTLDAISFFGLSDKITSDDLSTVNVHWVFFVNLTKIKPLIAHRADAEVRQDVHKAMGIAAFGLNYQSCEFTIDNVLREYPGSRRAKLLNADMHPWHCFRLNYKMIFDPKKVC